MAQRNVRLDVVFHVLCKVYTPQSKRLNVASIVPALKPAYKALDAIGLISFFLVLSLVGAQRLFPEKCNGNMQKTSVAVALLFLNGRAMFTVFAPPTTTLCVSAIESATARTNWRCALQGFMVVFGSYAASLWCSVRSYEVFAVVVFGYTRTTAWIVGTNLLCWGAPMIIAVAAVGTGSLSFVSTYFCAPSLGLLSGFVLYPLIVYPFFLLD